MSQAFSALPGPQQAQATAFCDLAYRPLIRQVEQLRAAIEGALAAALVSPSGLASAASAPAADCVWGLLQTLAPGESVPIGTTGFAGAVPVPAANVLSDLGALATIDASYFTPALIQARKLAIGPGQ